MNSDFMKGWRLEIVLLFAISCDDVLPRLYGSKIKINASLRLVTVELL
jgi:hypothetical protein